MAIHKTPLARASNWKLTKGKYKGEKIMSVAAADLRYLDWALGAWSENNNDADAEMLEVYLSHPSIQSRQR